MNTAERIRQLAVSLGQAAGDHDWLKVQSTDRQIAALLGELQGKSLDAASLDALRTLQKAHRQVNDYCRGQSEIISAKMALTRRNREGATAYAAFMEEEDIR